MSFATPTDLKEWFEEGLRRGATHMIILVDNAYHYVMPHERVRAILAEYDANQSVWQVFKLTPASKDFQCNAFALYRQPVRNL